MVGVGATRRSWAAAVVVLQAAWALVGGQVRYSVPEEAEAGTVVGRLAQDLGLEAGEAEAGRLRLVARGRRASVEVSGASGALVVATSDQPAMLRKKCPSVATGIAEYFRDQGYDSVRMRRSPIH